MRIRNFALSLAALAVLALVPSAAAQERAKDPAVVSARKALVAASQEKATKKATAMKRFQFAQQAREAKGKKDKGVPHGQVMSTRKRAIHGPAGPAAAAARAEFLKHRVAPSVPSGAMGSSLPVGRRGAIQKARPSGVPHHRSAAPRGH